MKHLWLYIFSVAFFLNIPAVIAQSSNQSARGAYISKADQFLDIFTGRIPEEYPNIYTGTYYLLSRQFIEGSLYYNEKYYDKLWLNINADRQLLYVLAPDKKRTVVLDPLLVSELWLGEEKFVYYASGAQPGLSVGFYSVLWDGKLRLLKYTRKRYIERINNQQMELIRNFEVSTQYYLLKDGRAHSISGRRDIIKALGSHKRELSRWAAQAPVDFRANPEYAYTQCLYYYVSLQTPE